MKFIALILIAALTLNAVPNVYAQSKFAKPPEVFEKVELLLLNGGKVEKLSVRLRLEEKSLIVESKKSGEALKTFNYDAVKSADYSYSKHPRWKAGAGTVAAGVAVTYSSVLLMAAFPILLAIPAGFALAKSKAKRHWLTIKTGDDYAVLRLDKDFFRLVIPAIETRTGVKVEDVGEKK
ncbi:MAG: hypothetical protein ACKVZH_04090 [Blastocatellia bacterium]